MLFPGMNARETVETPMIVKILPNETQDPPTKLADAELLFEEGVLSGLRLTGFSIWESRAGHARSVTFPARTFYVRGERRVYALLRPMNDLGGDPLKRLILQTYDEFEHRQAVAT
jgi:hypothetical protein